MSDGGESSYTSTQSATPSAIPGAPVGVSADADDEEDAIVVAWTDGDDGGASPIDSFVHRSCEGDAVEEDSPYSHSVDDGVPCGYWVRHENTHGAGAWSARTASETTVGLPGTPQDLRAVPLAEQVRIYWSLPADLGGSPITGWRLRKNGTDVAPAPAADAVTAVVDGTNGVPMTLKLWAINARGASATEAEIEGKPEGLPGRVEDPAAETANGAVLLTWDAPTENGGSAVTGYVLASTEPVELDRANGAADGNAHAWGLASNGEDYVLGIQAVNGRGTGPALLSPVQATPARNPAQPSDVEALAADEAVTLSWEPPADDGGHAVTGYLVTREPDPPFSWQHEVAAPSAEIIELVNGKAYVFYVRAINDVTEPHSGPAAALATPVVPCGVPGDPVVSVAVSGDRQLRVSWLAPAYDGGVPVSAYDLFEQHGSEVGSSTWHEVGVSLMASVRSHVFEPSETIDSGTPFRFRVDVHTGETCGVGSANSSSIDLATLPIAPTLGSPTEGDAEVTIEWSALSDAEAGYAELLGFQVCAQPRVTPCIDAAPDALEATVRSLVNGGTYRFDVRARNLVGLGATATTTVDARPCGAPWAPSDLAVAQTGDGQLTLTWSEPDWTGGCDVDRYEVDGFGATLEDAASPEVRSGLTGCDVHEVRVRTVTTNGAESEWSEPVEAAVPEPPDAPTSVTTDPGDGLVRVCWEPPATDGCSPITGYRVYLTHDSVKVGYDAESGDARCIVIGDDEAPLENTELYEVTVAAVNVADEGPESSPVDETPEEPGLVAIVVPTELAEHAWSYGHAHLNGIARTATAVSLRSSADVSVPATATVPVGSTSISFRIDAHDVSADTSYWVDDGPSGSVQGDGTVLDLGAACWASDLSPDDGDEIFDFGAEENRILATFDCTGWAVHLRMVDDPDGWREWCTGTDDEISGEDCPLIDPTLLLNGQYELRFEAGSSEVATRRFIVTGRQKVGHFTMSFADMTVPAAGMAIQVIRTYDSRDPRVGDFGVGWQLSFNDIRVEKTVPLATEWVHAFTGQPGTFGWLWHRVDETRRHRVTATFPDGRVYIFEPRFSYDGDDFRPAGISEPTLGGMFFVPVPPTRGTLRVAGAGAQGANAVQFLSGDGLMCAEPCDLGDVVPWEPEDFVLTTEDGTEWHVTVGEGLTSATDRNGNTVSFDSEGIHHSPTGRDVLVHRNGDGVIDWIEDPNGNRTHYAYDALTFGSEALPVLAEFRDRTQAIGSPVFTAFEYQSAEPHLLVSVTDPTGRRASLACYDDDGRLKRTCDGLADPSDCEPDADVHVEHCAEIDPDLAEGTTVMTDRRGYSTTLHYDDRGLVTDRWDPGIAASWHYEYSEDELLTLARNPLGHETRTTYDANGHPSVVEQDVDAANDVVDITCFDYTATGELLRTIRNCDPETREGVASTSTFDENGNMLTERDATGVGVDYTYDEQGNIIGADDGFGHVVVVEWSHAGFLSRTDPTGLREEAEHDYFDESGELVDDDNGNLRAVQLVAPNGDVRRTEMTYDEENRLTSTIDADGGVSTTVHDAAGRVIRRISQGGRITDTHHDETGEVTASIMRASAADPEDPPNPGDEVTSYVRDDAGNVLQETGPDGLVTRFAYDPLNRLVKTCWGEDDPPEPDTDPDTTEPGCVSQIFDAAGRLIDSVNELGHRTTFVHDEAGRQVQVVGPDPDGGGPAEAPVFETRHDALGRVAWTRDPRGVFTTHEYDDADRELSTCLAEDADDNHELDPEETLVECTTFEHDDSGRRVAEVDALGHRTSHVFNDAGQHVGVVDELEHATTYGFNGFGELVSWTDSLGRTTRLEHDAAGHRTARILPMLQREEWTHDDEGKVTSHRDFEGRVTTFEHDVFGRLEHVDHPRDPDVTYTYWPGGARHEVTIEGSDPVTYDYGGSDRGWLSRVTTPDYAIEHEHDAAGNRTLTRTIVPQAVGPDDEHEVEYAFDEAGRLSKVMEGSVVQAEYGYDVASLLASVTYANGVAGSFASDLAGRQKTITWTNATTTLASFDWSFDAAGRRESVAELGGKTVNYTHDDVNRLVREEHLSGATCVRDIAYEYDSVGNRTSKTVECATMSPEVTTYAHDENDRMLSAGGEMFTYDENGNTLTAGATTYEWDDENRLIGADTGDVVLGFEYDADGIRQATTRDAVRTVHVVDGSWTYPQVVEERDAAGDLVRRYLRGYQAIRQDDASTEWLMQDHLGSTRAMADGAGDLLGAIDYEAFGTAIGAGSAGDVGLRFDGEEWDFDLGMTYLRARWFDPETGTLPSRDVVWLPADARASSAHAFANQSPVLLGDPTGRESISMDAMLTQITDLSYLRVVADLNDGRNSFLLPLHIRTLLPSTGRNTSAYPPWTPEEMLHLGGEALDIFLEGADILAYGWAEPRQLQDDKYYSLSSAELANMQNDPMLMGHGAGVVFVQRYWDNVPVENHPRPDLFHFHHKTQGVSTLSRVTYSYDPSEQDGVLAHEVAHQMGIQRHQVQRRFLMHATATKHSRAIQSTEAEKRPSERTQLRLRALRFGNCEAQ